MKPAPFDYVRAETMDEALALLAETGDDARILAGGQSLIAMLNMRLARPAVLVDVMQLTDLQKIEVRGDKLRVGAGVRQHQLLARNSLASEVPLLAKALPWVGHAQTRARGTICGSVAHADPSAELPLCLSATGGTVHLRASGSKRDVSARDFFTGMMTTAIQPGELIEAVSFPLSDSATGFREIGRRHGDFAIVAVAAICDGGNLRVTVGGVDDVPRVSNQAPDADIDDALNDLAWSMDARSDLHASGRYRRDLVRKLGKQAIDEARNS